MTLLRIVIFVLFLAYVRVHGTITMASDGEHVVILEDSDLEEIELDEYAEISDKELEQDDS